MNNVINDELASAIEIYTYLIERKNFNREENTSLFDLYTNENIQKLVKFIAQKSNLKIELINNTIYLIPNMDNRLFSYTKPELKSIILKSSKYNDSHYYLANFIILELLTTFYNSTNDHLAMFQISYNDFENRVNESIKRANEHNLEELENNHNIAFINIINNWNSLKGSEGTAKLQDTRYGFVTKILTFLDNEKLINWYENDGIIVPTKKLTDLVTGVILYKPEFKRTEELFNNLMISGEV